jgi:Tol biopolymer transport system component
LVYAIETAGQQSLWVRQVATGSDEQIVQAAAANYLGITFSRDGNFIYYVRRELNAATGALYRKPVLGGDEKKLFANVDSPITLSPEGDRLAFVRRSGPVWEYSLTVANVDGSGEKILATRSSPDYFTRGPAWSPDGKLIACGLSKFSGSFYATVVGVSVDGGGERPLTAQRWFVSEGRMGAASGIGRIAWLPDGDGLILTASEVEGGQPQIWLLSYPQGVARKITADLNDYADVSLTADSESLAAVRFERTINIWISSVGGARRAKQITSGSGREDGVRGLAWTPDGRILYRSIAGGHPDIWLMGGDGEGNRQLSSGGRNNIDPSISLDGHDVVWGSNRTGIFNIWRMEIDGSNPKQLTYNGGEWFPQISPDGKWLVYRAFSPGLANSLWKMPLEGGTPVRLTDDIAWLPSISPDGKRIACNYLTQKDAKWQIAIVPFEGGQPRFFDPSYHRPVRWTPDGRALAYPAKNGGVSNIWLQPLDGGKPKQLTDFQDGLIFDFAWSRDGKQLALSRGMVNSDVVLMSNFK